MDLSKKRTNPYETVQIDCASISQGVRQGEMPSSQRLVSIFLEGLANKSLHANLPCFAKKHNTLNSCIKDAIDFDDNCEIFGNVNASARLETSSTKNTIETGKGHPVNAEAIAEMVMKKMNQVF